MTHVLLIEDDAGTATEIRLEFGMLGYLLTRCALLEDDLAVAVGERIDLLIVDRQLPDSEGLDLIQQLRTAGRRTPVLVLSAIGSLNDRGRGLRAGGERLQGIGVSSDGRANTIVTTSRIPEFPGGVVDDGQVVAWFAHYYRVTSDEIAQGIKASEDKYQWQMRTMIQPTPTDPNTGPDPNDGHPIAPAGRPSAPVN